MENGEWRVAEMSSEKKYTCSSIISHKGTKDTEKFLLIVFALCS